MKEAGETTVFNVQNHRIQAELGSPRLERSLSDGTSLEDLAIIEYQVCVCVCLQFAQLDTSPTQIVYFDLI